MRNSQQEFSQKEMGQMNETTKIRPLAIKYCEGCGIDLGCGDEKIRPEAIGIDAGMDVIHSGIKEWRDLSVVNIKHKIVNLNLFESNSFSYVYSSHFLEHLADPELMLKEMTRVTCPGGHVVVYLPDRLLYTQPNSEHKHMWTLDEFLNLLPDCLEVVENIAKHEDYSFFIAAKKRTSE